jgi:hypothetical protein
MACGSKFEFDTRDTASGGAIDVGRMLGGSTGASGGDGQGGSSGSGSWVRFADYEECSASCESESLHCLPSALECVECTVNDDCIQAGLPPFCNPIAPAANRCVACVYDIDCSGDQRCEVNTHTCVSHCKEDDDCSGHHSTCNLQKHYCMACFDDGDCDHGQHCATTRARCVDCLTDDDCTDPERSFCDPVMFQCVNCRDTNDCADDDCCDALSHVCH